MFNKNIIHSIVVVLIVLLTNNSMAYKKDIIFSSCYTHKPINLINRYFSSFDSWNNLINNNLYEYNNITGSKIIIEDKQYVVIIEVPGYDKNHILISIKDNYMTINGDNIERSSSNKANIKKNYYKLGKFSYIVKLNSDIDQKLISSNLKNGILTIFLPRILSLDNKSKIIPIY